MRDFKYSDIVFDYYGANIHNTKSEGQINLQQFLDAHKNPKPEIVEAFQEIEKAAKEGDLKLKDKLKSERLYFFTPTVLTNGQNRNYESIVSFNEVMVAEFDKIDNAEEVKKELFERLKCCIACYLSPSKKGVKLLLRIPPVNSVESYKEYFYGLAYYLDRYTGFDPVNRVPTQPLFLSYDRNILIRNENEVEQWTIRGGKLNSFKPYEGEIELLEDVTEEDVNEIKYIIKTFLDRVTENGHGNLVQIASLAGGFVASAYWSYDDAVDYITDLISEHFYYQSKLNTYIKTTREMVKRGTSSPLKLKRHQNA